MEEISKIIGNYENDKYTCIKRLHNKDDKEEYFEKKKVITQIIPKTNP